MRLTLSLPFLFGGWGDNVLSLNPGALVNKHKLNPSGPLSTPWAQLLLTLSTYYSLSQDIASQMWQHSPQLQICQTGRAMGSLQAGQAEQQFVSGLGMTAYIQSTHHAS